MTSKHEKCVRKRTGWLLIIFGLLYLCIGGRLFYIQVLKRDHYSQIAEKRLHKREILAERGVIYDRVGRELATNVPACAIYAHPKKTADAAITAAKLANVLGRDTSSLEKALRSGKPFIYLARQVPVEIGERVRDLKLESIGVLSEKKRVYPSGNLAGSILGFTDIDGNPLEGIERSANKFLLGKSGYEEAEVDAKGRVIPESRRGVLLPVNGSDITLTIDAYLQHVTETALEKTFTQYSAVGATAIVLDPRTGEILALANCPSFDPNNRSGVRPEAWRNRAVTDLYEPGSTLKLVTVAAGLEEGISPDAKLVVCSRDGMQIGKNRVRCSLHHPYLAGHGSVDMYKTIEQSCNIGAAAIAFKIGPEKLHSYAKAFGLVDKPGSGFAGETFMPLGRPEDWPAIRLATIGFGQGIAVSALQMADAYAVIANGGNLMRPQIIREIRGSDGQVAKPFKPEVVRRAISEETARKATEMLRLCVDEGTGKTAKVEGYSVAGKTGSAQKVSSTGRGYVPGKFVASFMGFVPASNPKLVICVIVDEPLGSHWGATVAAPVFQEIARKAMWYLRVPPDQPSHTAIPDKAACVGGGRYGKLGADHTG